MSAEDPWGTIDSPTSSGAINARRIPEIGTDAWGLYWGLDARNHCLLILQHRAPRTPSLRLPRLRGLLVEQLATEDGKGFRVVIRLIDGEQKDVFLRFCLDVVEATRIADSEEAAISRFLSRTWRWHRLLRSGQDGRLSGEEQKGLLGELRLLESHLLVALSARAAVDGWVGPIGAPKDFEIGLVCVEVKAPSPQRQVIVVSSLDQLDIGAAARLFLYVSEIASAAPDSRGAVTVTDVAERVRKHVEARDVEAASVLEDRLNAVGLSAEDDYSDTAWVLGDETLFEVSEGFPRITRATVPTGVEDVRYSVVLSAGEPFVRPLETLGQAISGGRDGS